jgi:hypothetical protein
MDVRDLVKITGLRVSQMVSIPLSCCVTTSFSKDMSASRSDRYKKNYDRMVLVHPLNMFIIYLFIHSFLCLFTVVQYRIAFKIMYLDLRKELGPKLSTGTE